MSAVMFPPQLGFLQAIQLVLLLFFPLSARAARAGVDQGQADSHAGFPIAALFTPTPGPGGPALMLTDGVACQRASARSMALDLRCIPAAAARRAGPPSLTACSRGKAGAAGSSASATEILRRAGRPSALPAAVRARRSPAALRRVDLALRAMRRAVCRSARLACCRSYTPAAAGGRSSALEVLFADRDAAAERRA